MAAKQPRPASSYRGARRNACLRTKPKGVWGPRWYYKTHVNRRIKPVGFA